MTTAITDTAMVPASSSKNTEAEFDDVMLAMDIVDTLRHRTLIVEREMSMEDREAALIDRLREIYHAQGIDVPDRILKDGVKALEENRFVYAPPKSGLQHSLAKIYINRSRWLKPFGLLFAVAAFASASYEFGYEQPKQRAAEAVRVELSVTVPRELVTLRDAALELAKTDIARRRIETSYQDGVSAANEGQLDAAKGALTSLENLKGDLSKDLTIRVVSRPGEYSGVFRIPDASQGQRNYYLIVEAVDAGGRSQSLEIASEEDQSVKRTEKWGVRVPEGEFNRIAADKQDDQIIQNAVVGSKPTGHLLPEYSVPIAGGAILEW